MRGQERDPRLYELLTILSPDVPEEDLTTQVDRLAAYVTSAGGTIQESIRESPWGRRRLAYPIRHDGRDVRDGYYTLFHIELTPHRLEDVERELKLNPNLMRYLLTSYTPVPVDPRAIEEAEAAAEEAAAEAYAAAQAVAARAASAPSAETAAEPAETDMAATAEPAEDTTAPAESESAATFDDVAATSDDVPAMSDDVPATSNDAVATSEAETSDAPAGEAQPAAETTAESDQAAEPRDETEPTPEEQ